MSEVWLGKWLRGISWVSGLEFSNKGPVYTKWEKWQLMAHLPTPKMSSMHHPISDITTDDWLTRFTDLPMYINSLKVTYKFYYRIATHPTTRNSNIHFYWPPRTRNMCKIAYIIPATHPACYLYNLLDTNFCSWLDQTCESISASWLVCNDGGCLKSKWNEYG